MENVKSKGDQAKELLAKYGGAYLATSITISLISFGLCYALISAGVDVQSLLQKVHTLRYSWISHFCSLLMESRASKQKMTRDNLTPDTK